MTAPANNATFYADFKSLAALKHEAKTDGQQALRGAAQQFESLFINMMLKNMRQATSSVGDSISGGNEMDLYQGMYDQQIATQIAKGKGLGLADMLVQQLTRSGLVKNSPSTASPANAGKSGDSKSSDVTQATVKSGTGHSPGTQSIPGLMKKSPALTKPASVTPRTASLQSASPAEFVQKLWPHAVAAAKKLGVDPTTLIAHAALETGWGKHVPCNSDGSSSYNLFGIKAGSNWNGQSVGTATLEYSQGVAVKRVERFKAYDSPTECFADYASLLSGHSRYSATLNSGANTAQFAQALQSGGYATDPHYAHKLNAVARNVMSIVNAASTTTPTTALANNVTQVHSTQADT